MQVIIQRALRYIYKKIKLIQFQIKKDTLIIITDEILHIYNQNWIDSGDSSNGLWHLLTNCFPPIGTVGLAYIATTCSPPLNVGWSTWENDGLFVYSFLSSYMYSYIKYSLSDSLKLTSIIYSSQLAGIPSRMRLVITLEPSIPRQESCLMTLIKS